MTLEHKCDAQARQGALHYENLEKILRYWRLCRGDAVVMSGATTDIRIGTRMHPLSVPGRAELRHEDLPK
jgi:hypothetical protein